jgi:Sulfotransferase domain
MSLKVIGSGMGRTGTHSLKLALEKLLGAPCYHMMEVFPRPHHFKLWTAAARGENTDWHALFDGFVAAVDWPAAAFWEEISAAFPEAIILHSERDPESWWKSASATIFAKREGGPPPPMKEMLGALMGARFTADIYDKDAAIAAYKRNNAHVRAAAPKDRLLLWSPGDGWGPICKALELPVPTEPFPHSNTTEEFNARIG